MAPDERDRSFDKALARHLRSAAPAEQGSACPDPETLAAYHERSLLPEQLNSLKEHLVGCANCQAVLAHLETTDEIPLQAVEENQLFAQTVSAARAVPNISRRLLLLRGPRWQWLAPAGAIAAGLLVWVGLHENHPSRVPTLPKNENEVAQNRAPAAPIPSIATGALESSSPAKRAAALGRPQSRIRQYAEGKQSGTGVGSAKPSERELQPRKDEQSETATDQLSVANRADLDAKNLPDTLQKKAEAQSQTVIVTTGAAPVQNTPAQNSYNYAPQKVPGPGPLNQAEAPKKAKETATPPPAPAPPPAQPGVVGGIASGYNDSTALEVARGRINPRLIAPPGSRVLWRTGRSGLIELSKDGGSSWSRQTSGVLTDLLTGSASSDQLCWIVGRVGTILLTADGGAHWKVVPSPLAEDLEGVRASDALHATIWNSCDTQSF